jgi:hypothetical protein
LLPVAEQAEHTVSRRLVPEEEEEPGVLFFNPEKPYQQDLYPSWLVPEDPLQQQQTQPEVIQELILHLEA